MNRPKISSLECGKILSAFFSIDVPGIVVIAVRGYFKKSIGKNDANDLNLWDDAMMVCENGKLLRAFNANTDPSKKNAELAMLDTGIYRFAKGRHKDRIDAFRAYPEGVRLKCKRQDARGNWFPALCSAINLHDGGEFDTWSAGCQTLPNYRGNKQFEEFRSLVYRLMDQHRAKTFTYLLIDEDQMQSILNAPPEIVKQSVLVIGNSSATVAPTVAPPQVTKPEPGDAQSSGSPAGSFTDKANPSDTSANDAPPPIQPPPGDQPSAAPKQWLNVEDYKPFVLRMLKRIWAAFAGLVTAYVTTIVATAQNADYSDWRVWVAIAAIGCVFLFVVAAFFTLICMAVLYFNRKEIVGYKTEEIKSLINPNIYNFGLKFEKK